MCFKKKTNPILPTERRALLFAINNYPGTANDLNGCLDDQDDIYSFLKINYPGFDIRSYRDSNVKAKTFLSELNNSIAVLRPSDILFLHYSGHGTQISDSSGDESDGYDEAIYLYDKPVVDDDIREALTKIPDGAMVMLAFDSCFSGTITRELKEKHKIKFMAYTKKPIMGFKNKKMTESEKNYICFSGCGEEQTSADAYIDGRYNGAFTYFFLKAFKPGITYQEWIDNIHRYLPGNGYDQAPELEGDKSLFNKIIFT
jgi:metacaspase-1